MTDAPQADAAPALPPWRAPLARALHRNRADRASRYLQLATVRPDGRPANRTVVYRGFDTVGRLLLVTDARSSKAEELAVHPAVALCWYFAKTREQFRLEGMAELVREIAAEAEAQSARAAAWQGLSDAGRAQFCWPTPAAARDGGADEDAFPPAVSAGATIPASFVLLRVRVDAVDHLELRGSPQERTAYHNAEGGWEVRRINP